MMSGNLCQRSGMFGKEGGVRPSRDKLCDATEVGSGSMERSVTNDETGRGL